MELNSPQILPFSPPPPPPYSADNNVTNISPWVPTGILFLLVLFLMFISYLSPRYRVRGPNPDIETGLSGFRGRDHHQVAATQERLPKAAIRHAFQTFVHGKIQDEKDIDDCVICLGQFNEGDKCTTLLPFCKHTFHEPCIDQWILRSNNSCPLCRVALH
ncbi:RING-H2 finger protein ATL47 [Ricinus communis]|uniref:RING-type domain-containing protein n=1 Tax=Ricinus communis TaxID=3988 RepID=B9SVK9_RICCO|nr:RING-H2 finger protein ATL47 [Ricinus communis]EEF32328.1 conserved hypothetical protein [Ricinus communis]|eukprot:XP_002530028.1 RING-H2 finger protein ATL47 [Ricinus communis]